MGAVIAAAVISAIATTAAAKSHKRSMEKAQAANRAAQDKAFKLQKEMLDKAKKVHKKGIEGITGGFSEAEKTVSTMGHAARRRLLRRETAMKGKTDAIMADRGLYGSSSAVLARRGATAETGLQLAAVDESVSGMLSTLQRDRGMAVGQAYMQKMSLFGQFAGMGSQTLQAYTHQAAPGIGQSMGAAGGSLAQLLMMWQMQQQPGGQGGGQAPPTGFGPTGTPGI